MSLPPPISRKTGMSDAMTGTPAAKRLHDRKAVAFREGGHEERARSEKQPLQARRPETGRPNDVTLQRRASVEQIDDMLVLPSALADQEELGRRIAELGDEVAPDMQDEQMVLARLDRPAHDEIGVAPDRGCGTVVGRKDGVHGKRSDEDRHVRAPHRRQLTR